jgi:hypothetical protein
MTLHQNCLLMDKNLIQLSMRQKDDPLDPLLFSLVILHVFLGVANILSSISTPGMALNISHVDDGLFSRNLGTLTRVMKYLHSPTVQALGLYLKVEKSSFYQPKPLPIPNKLLTFPRSTDYLPASNFWVLQSAISNSAPLVSSARPIRQPNLSKTSLHKIFIPSPRTQLCLYPCASLQSLSHDIGRCQFAQQDPASVADPASYPLLVTTSTLQTHLIAVPERVRPGCAIPTRLERSQPSRQHPVPTVRQGPKPSRSRFIIRGPLNSTPWRRLPSSRPQPPQNHSLSYSQDGRLQSPIGSRASHTRQPHPS